MSTPVIKDSAYWKSLALDFSPTAVPSKIWIIPRLYSSTNWGWNSTLDTSIALVLDETTTTASQTFTGAQGDSSSISASWDPTSGNLHIEYLISGAYSAGNMYGFSIAVSPEPWVAVMHEATGGYTAFYRWVGAADLNPKDGKAPASYGVTINDFVYLGLVPALPETPPSNATVNWVANLILVWWHRTSSDMTGTIDMTFLFPVSALTSFVPQTAA